MFFGLNLALTSPVSGNAPTATATVDADASGTLIATIDGQRKVEELAVGDLILTMDRGYQPLRWIGCKTLDSESLRVAERLRPVRIKASALGPQMPESDLVVSPQHRMLLRSKLALQLFGESEVLVSARKLTLLDDVEVAEDLTSVSYCHLMFDQHEIVFANGAPSESLYLGEMTIEALPPEAREEIRAIFPNLEDEDFRKHLARVSPPRGREVRALLSWHRSNAAHVLEDVD